MTDHIELEDLLHNYGAVLDAASERELAKSTHGHNVVGLEQHRRRGGGRALLAVGVAAALVAALVVAASSLRNSKRTAPPAVSALTGCAEVTGTTESFQLGNPYAQLVSETEGAQVWTRKTDPANAPPADALDATQQEAEAELDRLKTDIGENASSPFPYRVEQVDVSDTVAAAPNPIWAVVADTTIVAPACIHYRGTPHYVLYPQGTEVHLVPGNRLGVNIGGVDVVAVGLPVVERTTTTNLPLSELYESDSERSYEIVDGPLLQCREVRLPTQSSIGDLRVNLERARSQFRWGTLVIPPLREAFSSITTDNVPRSEQEARAWLADTGVADGATVEQRDMSSMYPNLRERVWVGVETKDLAAPPCEHYRAHDGELWVKLPQTVSEMSSIRTPRESSSTAFNPTLLVVTRYVQPSGSTPPAEGVAGS